MCFGKPLYIPKDLNRLGLFITNSYLFFLFAAIFLNVLANALALPVHPGFVIGVHLPLVPLLFIDAVAFWIHFLAMIIKGDYSPFVI